MQPWTAVMRWPRPTITERFASGPHPLHNSRQSCSCTWGLAVPVLAEWGVMLHAQRSMHTGGRTPVREVPPGRPPLAEAAVPGVDDVRVLGALAQGLQRAGARLDGLEQVDGLPHARVLQGVRVVAGETPRRSA